MVNYSNIFPLSTGSGNNQIIVVNTNTTLNNGGFYQTGNLTADIEIDISNVPVNDEIAFYNTSTKKVVISGISTVDNVSIPTNKGVRISSNNGGGFIKNISDNINKRLGSYTVDWIPGQEPPYITEGLFSHIDATSLSGTTVNDLSGNKVNWTALNPLVVNGAFSGFSVSRYLNRNLGSFSAITMQVLVKRTGTFTTYAGLLMNRTGSQCGLFTMSDGRIGVEVPGNWSSIHPTVLVLNTWYLVTFRANQSGLQIFLNNEKASFSPSISSVTLSNMAAGIHLDNGQPFVGDIKAVLIYNRVLLDAEVSINVGYFLG